MEVKKLNGHSPDNILPASFNLYFAKVEPGSSEGQDHIPAAACFPRHQSHPLHVGHAVGRWSREQFLIS